MPHIHIETTVTLDKVWLNVVTDGMHQKEWRGHCIIASKKLTFCFGQRKNELNSNIITGNASISFYKTDYGQYRRQDEKEISITSEGVKMSEKKPKE